MEQQQFKDVQSLWVHRLLHEYLAYTIAVPIIVVASFYLIPLWGLALIALYLGFTYEKARAAFFKIFADANGFLYAAKGDLSSVSGRLFQIGGEWTREIHHVMSREYQGYPMRLFQYSYAVKSGKSSRTYRFTVCEIRFEKTLFPYILLRSKTMAKYGGTDFFGSDKDREVPLEGSAQSAFQLMCHQKYEIEALQIFTPSLLALLMEGGKDYSIEFSEHALYVYDNEAIGNQTALQNLYGIVEKMVTAVGPLLNRLHDDFDALHKHYKNDTTTSLGAIPTITQSR